MAKRTDLTALMAKKKLTPEPINQKRERGEVSKRRTLSFSDADEGDLDRIEAYLRERGYSRVATAKLIRIAVRVAFREDLDDERVRDIVDQVIEEDGRRKG